MGSEAHLLYGGDAPRTLDQIQAPPIRKRWLVATSISSSQLKGSFGSWTGSFAR